MAYLAVLAALVLVPTLAVLLLRFNVAIAFMGLCLGSVLVTYVSGDVDGIVTSFSASKGALVTNQWVQLGLLIVPFVLTVLFTRGSVKGHKRFINFFPAAATGLLFTLLVVPLLSASVQRQIHKLHAWHQLDALQTAVILCGAAFSLVFLLFTHRKKQSSEEAKPGKH